MELNSWMEAFLQALEQTFGERIWFVGQQGSYGRGEGTESSDIDMVVILDRVCVGDIQAYGRMLDGLPCRELACGFFSGKEELFSWEPSDLFQFYYDTKPIRGSLEELLSKIDGTAVNQAIKIGVCNIYHGCIHNMLYEKSDEILYSLYKSASFVVQAICFQQTGRYLSARQELLHEVKESERQILETFANLRQGEKIVLGEMSGLLFEWSQGWVKQLK